MSDWSLVMLIDGQCPLCTREARFLLARDKGGRLAMRDISAPDFDPTAHGLDREAVHRHIHAILPDGSVIRGMDVFRRAYAAVGLGWLMAPTGWPVLRPIFDLAYRIFARYRVRVGRLFGRPCDDDACGLAH